MGKKNKGKKGKGTTVSLSAFLGDKAKLSQKNAHLPSAPRYKSPALTNADVIAVTCNCHRGTQASLSPFDNVLFFFSCLHLFIYCLCSCHCQPYFWKQIALPQLKNLTYVPLSLLLLLCASRIAMFVVSCFCFLSSLHPSIHPPVVSHDA